jgi:hypothetical protein
MSPYSFQFYHPSAVDMFELRQQLAELHYGILHRIELNHPQVIVHYANFTKDDVRLEIETKGKMTGNWILYPLPKN